MFAQDSSPDGDSPVEILSNFWFKWGWGADFALTEKIYLCREVFYETGTNSKPQRNEIDSVSRTTKTIDKIINGLDVRLTVGYRF
ncbi:MAG: hypothetical protein LBK83_03895 [Treponema sp.]|jgi:hypothetical protein|nr:hypothetical protein [Treponema sp.]